MFDRLVGNERAKETLRRMLRQGRVPGALLFAGDEGLGKRLFALELARALNCRTRRGVEACGVCSSCKRVGRFEAPPAERDEYKKVFWSEHRDVGRVLPFNRNILVDAIRDLERECNFRPAEGEARVFLVEDAESLNDASSNALLKTLEEAMPTTHLILVTSRPAALLPTIRSRCQIVRFAPLGVEELEGYLIEKRKRAGEEARLAARLAAGRPGVALGLNLDTYRARRDAMLGVVEALAAGNDRVRLLRAAEELGDAKNKDEYEPRLDALELLIRDLWLLALDGAQARVVNYDLRDRLARLAASLRPARAARWLAHVEELRAHLNVNINRRAATDALFLGMASD
ncbi:MAG TPA: DNA polymerase III subunit delta' [Pyrinomonadaceae bacterium]|jgi:DNA polymerase-3 subunit delta'|nr:DNA polymerase III subunit delta' [Pyrinomonadaceae bacterium]